MKRTRATRRSVRPTQSPTTLPPYTTGTLMDCAQGAGKVLLKYFGQITNPRRKGSTSSIVCDADLAAEKLIVQIIRSRFPDHGIIAEETGFHPGISDYIWVVDPLDGTSNFVAGLPWFGVQLGLLHHGQPVAAVMYLPLQKTIYYAEAGQGTHSNGGRLKVTSETDPRNTLCAFGFDPDPGMRGQKQSLELLRRVSNGVRNMRATNSLVDFCYTVEGKFGGCINLCTKIWDIVPISLILPEAGGIFSDLHGNPITFDLTPKGFGRTYAVLGAPTQLHPRFVHLLSERTR